MVAKATDRLLTEFERLGLKVGLHKCMVLGSCKKVKDRLLAHMNVLSRGRCIPIKIWGKKQGIQYSMQQRRLSSVMKARLQRAGVRSGRVSKLQRGTTKQQRHKLYNTAVRPVATYGGAYWGFPDSTVDLFRRQVARVHGGAGRFRSTSLLCLLRPLAWKIPQ